MERRRLGMLGVIRRLFVGVVALTPLLGGCVYANGFYESFDYRIEPVPSNVMPVSLASDEGPPSATEIRYARDTARIVFRRRPSQRTPGFVPAGAGGYAICLRSGKDYALLVFERRVFEEAISQAADDARILRSASDTAICRESGRRWIAV